MTLFTRIAVLALFAGALAACSDVTTPDSQQMNAAAPGVPVDVAEVVQYRLADWDSFTGRLEAPQQVALRPRVSGYIEFVAFEEGEWVEQGETLFLIDNRAFKAEVNRLTAQLNEAKSRLALARQERDRAMRLHESRSVSEETLDSRQAAVVQAEASVAGTEAQLELARLNRGFARVEAPISGRISRANITPGNYVTAGETVLTSIVSSDQLYAYFDIDERTYLDYVAQQQGNLRQLSQLPVALRLANQSEYQHWGALDFIDNQVNTSTGTVRVRAVFDNHNGELLPGLFAHIKLANGHSEPRILIDEKAIGTDLNNKFVLVVNDDNNLAYRAVTLGDKMGGLRVIESGLKASESIVVNGLQRVRPGAQVDAHHVEMAAEEDLSQMQAWQQHLDRYTAETTVSTATVGNGS